MGYFKAFLLPDLPWGEDYASEILPFAQVHGEVLRRWGGEYAALAEKLEQTKGSQSSQVIHERPRDFYCELLRQQFDDLKEKIADDFSERGYDFDFWLHPQEINESNIEEVSSIEVITINIIDSPRCSALNSDTATFEVSAEIIFSVEFTEFDHDGYVGELHEETDYPTINHLLPDQTVIVVVNVETILPSDDNPELEIESVDLTIKNTIFLNYKNVVLPEFDEFEDDEPDIEWQEIEFEVVTIEFYEYPPLVPFDFEVATLIVAETNIVQRTLRRSGIKIEKSPGQAYQFVELLNDSRSESLSQRVILEMVQIPAGEFMMGAPNDEAKSLSKERPQHLVNVPEFYLGKYPITQEQWRFGASLPKIDLELKLDPSHFKGNNLPVEIVSWFEATEFCGRLSRHTKREYRLPSEAEWEYACRARTTTPFHFGETITTDLANYSGKSSYGRGSNGIRRGKTTPVDMFPPNAFGLYDLHGNVWEWCQDHDRGDYTKAPTDGSASFIDPAVWNAHRIARGGNFFFSAHQCRSASRYGLDSDYHNFTTGFRIACSSSSTN